MKTINFYSTFVLFFLSCSAFAQVQIDKQIQLTGSGTDAKINGIRSVADSLDATNVQSVQSGSFIYADATGSGNNFNLNLSPPVTAYQKGMFFNFISNQNITGPATINVNNTGAKTIKKNINHDIGQCDIQNGQMVTAVYDGVNFQMTSVSVSPAAPATPVATAATTVVSHQITANWNAVSGASGYQLDVSTASNFTPLTGTYDTLNTSYTVTGLTPVTTYYYRVRAVNGCGGASGNSDTITATTLNIGNDIVAYWKLDGNSNDAVGSNNGSDANITYSNINGIINNGAGFNGTSSLISLGNIVSGQVNLTLTAWIKTSDNSSDQQWVICQRDANYDGEFAFYVSSGQLNFWDFNISGGLAFSGTGSSINIADGNWHFIAFTKNGTTGTFYLDGMTDGTITAGYNVTYGTMTGGIGYDHRAYVTSQPPDQWFNGDIDEVGVWKRALSAGEIAALYNSGAGLQYPF